MSFQFSFFDESEKSDDQESKNAWYEAITIAVKESVKILMPDSVTLEESVFEEVVITNDCCLFRYIETNILAFQPESDLIPGVYEGGFKVWECTLDIIRYLSKSEHLLGQLRDKTVLDLGCGHGFLGIYALKHSCKRVEFSDFNEEVLRGPTCHNIRKNIGSGSNAICYGGDWISLHKYLLSTGGQSYDVILTAETIYNVDCCEKVLFMINEHLQEDGFALIATKRFYFGVGGGSSTLESLLLTLPKLKAKLVESYEDGVSNIRDLFIITKN